MDYKVALISCIERIPDENTEGLRKLYDMAKKELCRTRCAPSLRPDRRGSKRDLRDEVRELMIAHRLER